MLLNEAQTRSPDDGLRHVGSGRVNASAALFSPATRHQPAKVCVVAEIGVNHDGYVERALQLIDAAAEAGANAVKFQLFDPRRLLSNQALLAGYQKSQENDVFQMLDRLKLGLDDLRAARLAARRRGLAFIVTPFSVEDIPDLKQLEPDAVKIASPDAVNPPLLNAAAALGRPMLISTGAAQLTELGYAAGLVRDHAAGGCLLQCVSSYPTPEQDAALGAIAAIAVRFAVPVGYSDHTTDVMTGALAVAAGACLIEKHLTYDRTAAGPDHAASFEPATFADYAARIGRAAAMLGPRNKQVLPVEEDVRLVARQSLCAKRELPPGHTLTADDLTVKRPGTGIPAAHFDAVVGRRLLRPVKANDLLNEGDLV